jgi:hypothetical protein
MESPKTPLLRSNAKLAAFLAVFLCRNQFPIEVAILKSYGLVRTKWNYVSANSARME